MKICHFATMGRYERMARIIHFLEQQFREQPSLMELADLAGLSPTHFHREFKTWVGISPKDFVQGLTHAYAKSMLESGESVLDTSLAAGLSGPSRLHDLCVSLEAVTPGEIKSGGSGIKVKYGEAESPFGPCFVATSGRGICRLSFLVDGATHPEDSLRNEWPAAELVESPDHAHDLVKQVFQWPLQSQSAPLRLWVRGSAFQFKIWQALLAVPRGKLISYQRLGQAVRHPKASRAVGTAVGANPVAVLIPCHRVIRSTGVVQGYRWGTGRKRALIAWEAGRSVNQTERATRNT